ncbi:TRAP transporter large permease subunit [Fluviibacterium sp. DFM31]|uniref:TRAP transporter large permease subunit n=1 Tax=Meridianimarinicoccus marinus TaxID=3231483 RepID=A0ABV3L9S3_9RHOB
MLMLEVLLFYDAVVIGLPIAFALSLASVPTFLSGEFLPTSVAVAFFVMAGNIMSASGIAARLVTPSNALVGRMVGRVAQISIVLSLLRGGIAWTCAATVLPPIPDRSRPVQARVRAASQDAARYRISSARSCRSRRLS